MRLSLLVIFSVYCNISTAFTVGVETTDYAPYFYLDLEQKYQGAAREIIDLFSQSQKLELEYHPMPVPRLFNEFVKGRIDLKFPDNPLWSQSLQSDVFVQYSAPVLAVRETLLIIEPTKKYWEVDKRIKLVGTILGFSTPGINDNIKRNEFELINTKKIEQLIHMLVSGRVDAIYFNAEVAIKVATQLYPNKQLIAHPKYPAFDYAYHLSSIKHKELITQFDKFLISHAEQVTEIRNRYGLK
jgi:polar amino acid transport system substrate-binding protein